MLKLVLDTNVVLDWLVFNDAALELLTGAVQNNLVILPTHPAALDELRRVLNYPALKLDVLRQTAIFARHQAVTTPAILPTGFSAQNLLTPAGFPQCRDRDDQLFLALALHTHADALVSRDKAVLSLRKRAARFGVTIIDAAQMQVLLSADTIQRTTP
jgi:uncharacterized protein